MFSVVVVVVVVVVVAVAVVVVAVVSGKAELSLTTCSVVSVSPDSVTGGSLGVLLVG